MNRLSSCYFCGVALDESLRDYPLAPGDGDPNAVVTLCPTCRRKLETVLSTVTSSTAEGSEDPAIVTEAAAELDAHDRGAIEPGAGDDDEPLVAEAEGASRRDGGTEPLAVGDIETAADVTAAAESATDDGGDAEADDEPDLAGQPDDGAPDDPRPTGADEAGEKTQKANTSEVPEALRTGETSGEDATEEPEPDPDSATDSRSGVHETGVMAERDDVAGGDEASTGDDSTEPTLSALEYNKVMRLLQNREFPVDRTDLVDLAASAYGLTEPECGEVIDLAVDRGLVDQEAGKLVKPDD